MGFSGSLYAIKNYFTIDSLFAIDEQDQTSWTSFQTFLTHAHEQGLRVMLDLVINHTAIDIVKDHPSWYQYKWMLFHKQSGNPVKVFEEVLKSQITYDTTQYPDADYILRYEYARPYAINPSNTNDIQIWGDLAELRFEEPYLQEILTFFKKYLQFCIQLGVDGFRCDAAYQVEGSIWKELIDYAKKQNPTLIFWAETLGANHAQNLSLQNSGFDFLTNSSKYWDYTSPWCLEQYNEYRKIAPSISFPESHDTVRLAAESNGRRDVQIFKYLFAGIFSSGTFIPIGYEFGALTKLHVVNTKPGPVEHGNFDISKEIRKINTFVKSFPIFNEEGPMHQILVPNMNILLLIKEGVSNQEKFLLIYNKNWHEKQMASIPNLFSIFTQDPIFKYDWNLEKTTYTKKFFSECLDPNHFVILYQKRR